MPKSAMIRARIEPRLKQEVEVIFESLGLNTTEALSLFYHQVKLRQGMPFDIRLPFKEAPSAVGRGSLRALVKKAKGMSPNQRLEAFVNHVFLTGQMHQSGRAGGALPRKA